MSSRANERGERRRKRTERPSDADRGGYTPAVVDLADRDLKPLSQGGRTSRQARCTSESLLRALLVHTIEGEGLRGTIVRVSDSGFLQDFLRLSRPPR